MNKVEKNYSLGTAEEAFPKEFLENKRNRSTDYVYDYDKGGYVLNPDGTRAKKFDKKEFNKALRLWAKKFADHGIALNDIDFDQYRLEGYTIDKCPNKCVTVILHDGDFLIKDKRTGQESRWWEGSSRVYHKKKGGYREISKVPDSQLLEDAKVTWVIPEEVFVTDVISLQKERRGRVIPHEFRRYKPGEVSPIDSYHYRGSGSYLDKSGYLVDMLGLRKRLAEFKKARELGLFNGDLLALASEKITKLAQKGNELISKGLSALNTLIESEALQGDEGRLIDRIKGFKDSLKRCTRDLERAKMRLEEVESDEDKKDLEEGLKYDIDYFGDFFYKDYYGRDLREIVLELEKRVKEINSVTENIKGQNSNNTLQATEGYFISKELLSAFEEV